MQGNDKFIKLAYKNTPMYMKLGVDAENTQFSSLPILDKNYVIENESGAIAASSLLSYINKELMVARTSGSTGKYMEVYWKEADYNKSMLPLWLLRKKYYGINPRDKMCYFYTLDEANGADYGKIERKNKVGYSKSNLSMDKLKEIYLDMMEVKPVWMTLQPSMALLLCQCAQKYNLPKLESLKYIEMTGEILEDAVRTEVKNVFDCQVANQYGANEFNSIAFECPCGNMHILSSNVYVEVVKDNEIMPEGVEGEFLISTKTNSAMPLIRYKIGDLGSVHTSKCMCGNKRPILRLTSGRTNDWILCSNGERRMAYVIVRAIDCINYMLEGGVKQFQIIQKDIDDFVIKLVMDEDDAQIFEENSLAERFSEFVNDDALKSAKYEFEFYDEMFPEQIIHENGEYCGKFKYFRREMEEMK